MLIDCRQAALVHVMLCLRHYFCFIKDDCPLPKGEAFIVPKLDDDWKEYIDEDKKNIPLLKQDSAMERIKAMRMTAMGPTSKTRGRQRDRSPGNDITALEEHHMPEAVKRSLDVLPGACL